MSTSPVSMCHSRFRVDLRGRDERRGVVQKTQKNRVAAEIDAIVDRLRRFSSEVKSVGFEAGTLTQYLTYGLQAAGFEVICLEARQVSVTLAAMRNKTDRNDARGLAQILRTGWYSRVHVKSLQSHQVRALLASRKAILKKCVDLENELRGLLKVFGIRLPSRVGHGSFDAELRETVSTDEMLACALVPLAGRQDGALQDLPEARQRGQGAGARRSDLSPLDVHPWRRPGHRIDVQGRGRRPEPLQVLATVAAHFGLTPRRFQSGEVDNPGHISRAGDADVRSALYIAAHSLLTRNAQWSTLKAWGVRLAKTVATAARSLPWPASWQ